jgi:hypothetical protein
MIAACAVLVRVYDRHLCGMTIPAPEPDPYARERASDGAAAAGAVVGGDRAAAGGGELRLLVAPEREDPRAVPEPGARPSIDGPGRLRGSSAQGRRLRLAPPVQLELVSDRKRPRPEVVWASLPERAREQVLVLLARLIGSGAVEESEGGR